MSVTDRTILKATAKFLKATLSIQFCRHIRSLEPNIAGGGTFYSEAFLSYILFGFTENAVHQWTLPVSSEHSLTTYIMNTDPYMLTVCHMC